MSDGNFNRSLLPHTPYHSGLQTGKAKARMKAVEAFREILGEEQPPLSPDEIDARAARFQALLAKKLR